MKDQKASALFIQREVVLPDTKDSLHLFFRESYFYCFQHNILLSDMSHRNVGGLIVSEQIQRLFARHITFCKSWQLSKIFRYNTHSATNPYYIFQLNNAAIVYRTDIFQWRLQLIELCNAQCVISILQSCNTWLIPMYLAGRCDRMVTRTAVCIGFCLTSWVV